MVRQYCQSVSCEDNYPNAININTANNAIFLKYKVTLKGNFLLRLLTALRKKAFENIVRKGENADNQHFLLFPQCFLHFPKEFSILWSHLFLGLQML